MEPLRTKNQVKADIEAKATQCIDYRTELLRDPKALFAKEYGSSLQTQLKVKVFEETEDIVYIVLRCLEDQNVVQESINNDDEEITEEELSNMSSSLEHFSISKYFYYSGGSESDNGPEMF